MTNVARQQSNGVQRRDEKIRRRILSCGRPDGVLTGVGAADCHMAMKAAHKCP